MGSQALAAVAPLKAENKELLRKLAAQESQISILKNRTEELKRDLATANDALAQAREQLEVHPAAHRGMLY